MKKIHFGLILLLSFTGKFAIANCGVGDEKFKDGFLAVGLSFEKIEYVSVAPLVESDQNIGQRLIISGIVDLTAKDICWNAADKKSDYQEKKLSKKIQGTLTVNLKNTKGLSNSRSHEEVFALCKQEALLAKIKGNLRFRTGGEYISLSEHYFYNPEVLGTKDIPGWPEAVTVTLDLNGSGQSGDGASQWQGCTLEKK